VSDLDRPRLALYVVLGVVVCFLGARYLGAQVHRAAAADTGAAAAAGAGAPAPARAPGSAAAEPAAAPPASVSVARADGGRVIVHVAGAVRHPGVYRFAGGARVNDALRRAGGPRAHADLDAVNLAAKLEDGRQILVPLRAAAGAGAGAAPAAGASTASADTPAAPINLNTATLEQLDTLDGVGPGIAKRILDYREQHGGFRRVEELGEVPGIGAKRLATLTPLVTV
jgi:competence protein ComEA